MKISIKFRGKVREFKVISNPYPHILVPTKKEVIHGWYFGFEDNGRRECTSERILLNPYNGCTVNCPMCYARSFGGYFEVWDKTGIVTVFKDFDLKLRNELSKLYWASCAYLSPSSEPFQKPLENTYHLSEKSADVFLDLNLPVDFITKRGDNIPKRILRRMAEHPYNHCLAQFTILSVDDEINRIFAPNGASVEEQFKAVRRFADWGVYTVVRMDPLFPGITDDEKSIRELVERAKLEGAKHIIFSLCDVGRVGESRRRILFNIVREHFPDAYNLWLKVYRFNQDGDIEYRRRVFKIARKICDEIGVTMALCMEFEEIIVNGKVYYRGLNEEFMTSRSCEGLDIPVYWRDKLDEPFKPLENCNGACLLCAKGIQKPVCGQLPFIRASALRYRDYRRMKPRYSNLKQYLS
ncbi:MAG: hypothetical protein DRJ21_01745 [Candidatus Methanomethylicota archaeon]|uniref:Radical SAM core domain-containing protein n=1 Tax=Thermoproteota archaeon TaxID=2056631 RepID=A0A497EUS8_9CREN|nr:MAG: hypothetical protein DRJ21_01745 [Candidatus Verstraetearchaeota archaeon]